MALAHRHGARPHALQTSPSAETSRVGPPSAPRTCPLLLCALAAAPAIRESAGCQDGPLKLGSAAWGGAQRPGPLRAPRGSAPWPPRWWQTCGGCVDGNGMQLWGAPIMHAHDRADVPHAPERLHRALQQHIQRSSIVSRTSENSAELGQVRPGRAPHVVCAQGVALCGLDRPNARTSCDQAHARSLQPPSFVAAHRRRPPPPLPPADRPSPGLSGGEPHPPPWRARRTRGSTAPRQGPTCRARTSSRSTTGATSTGGVRASQ